MESFEEAEDDQTKLLGLVVEWDRPGFKSAAETIERFQHGMCNYLVFPEKGFVK
jgi:hypothetical protein